MFFRAHFYKICVSCIAYLFFIGLWEAIVSQSLSLQYVIPSPIKVIVTLWEHVDRFILHSVSTLKEIVGGFILAFIMAFPLAWLMSIFEPLRAVLQPLFVSIQCIPMFTLAPIMVLWFGWSYLAIIIPIALMIFFPLTINIYQGLRLTPIALVEFFRLQNASHWQLFRKLQVPWAIPHIFAGFRISVSLAGIGAIAGEWAGAQEGLGLLMLESRRAADLEMMFGALLCVMSLSLILYGLVVFLEKRAIRCLRNYSSYSTPKVLAILLCLTLFMVACQERPREKEETVLILDWLPNPNHVAIYSGIEQGFFQEHGINLKILKIADPSDGIPYLNSNQVDLCLTYMPHTLHALGQGAEVIPVGILIQEPLNALIYRKNESITTPCDLNGKIVGYCVDGYHTKFLQAMFGFRGVVPKKWNNVSFDLVSTLANNQVDVIYGAYWNIEGENLLSCGIEIDYFPLSEFGVPPYYELIFLAKRNSFYASKDFLSSFQSAMQKSIDYAIQHQEEAFDNYLKANPDKSRKTQTWEREAWKKTIPTLAKEQTIDANLWNNFVEWLSDKNLININKKELLMYTQTK